MTSNVGSTHLLEGIDGDGHIRDDVRESVMRQLKGSFRPEFLNRVDDVVLFKPLTLEEITAVVDLLVRDLGNRLRDRGLTLDMPKEAEQFVAREGFDPVYGARPLKRFIQQEVETPIARKIIRGELAEGDKVAVALEGETLAVRAA